MDKGAILQAQLEAINSNLSISQVAKAYVFARFSVQNQLKRHEYAYSVFVAKYPTWGAMQKATLADIQALGLNFNASIYRDLSAALPDMPTIRHKIMQPGTDKDVRAWVAEYVPGLGYAKASFFLMLLGRLGVGCIDVHMGRILGVDPTKLRTRAGYEKAESKLGDMAGLTQWLTWIDHMGIEGVGHEVYFASQGVLN